MPRDAAWFDLVAAPHVSRALRVGWGVWRQQKHLADSAATQCIDISAKQHLTTGEKLSMDEMGSQVAAEAFRYYNR